LKGVVDIIQEKYSTLTKKQKDIADYMTSHTDDMCFTTLKNLSAEVGVSEMTILNLCTALGYPNFNEVKYEFRKYAAARRKESVSRDDTYVLPYIPKSELEDQSGLFRQMCQEELDGVSTFFSGLNIDEYFKAARMICRAKKVIICGRGVSIQLANYMLTRLTMTGVSCMTVDTESGDAVQSALYFIDGETLVIPVSFPDYYFMTVKLAQFARSKGASLLGITDSTRSEVAGICDMCIYCPTGTRLFLNSLTAPVIAVNFLTTAVNVEKSRRGGDMESLSIEFSKMFDGGC